MKKRIYDNYIDLKLWQDLNGIVDKLVENNDLQEQTDRYYIIGYIIDSLKKKYLIEEMNKK